MADPSVSAEALIQRAEELIVELMPGNGPSHMVALRLKAATTIRALLARLTARETPMADPSVSAEALEQRLRKQARGEMLNPLLIEAADALAAQRQLRERLTKLAHEWDGRAFYSNRVSNYSEELRAALSASPEGEPRK